jgi:heme exporter protein A
VDLVLAPGERLAVVGPNGAGKTTLLRMLATLLRPDAGDLAVAGLRLPDEAGRVRALIGYLGHRPPLYLDLSAWHNLELFADLHGLPRPRERIEEALDRVGLLGRAYDPVRALSRGMAQRLGLALALLHDPVLLLLDEPHVGLDARGAGFLDAVLARRDGGRGVVLVTHDLGRAVSLADRVIAMRAGRIALEEPTAGLDQDAFRRRYEELAA